MKSINKAIMTAILLVTATPVVADVGGQVTGGAYTDGVGGRWAAMSGTSMRETLEGWAREAGWTIDWRSDSDYRLHTSITFSGSFEDAVGRLINGIYRQHPEINATLYRKVRVLTVDDAVVSN